MKILQLSINLFIAAVISLCFDCWLGLVGNTEVIDTTEQQPRPQQQKKSDRADKLDFSGDGRPGRRTGGGSRNPCPISQIPLTALVPANNTGATVSDRPRFWFYVPYASRQAATGEFVLQDRQENDLYRQAFNLPQTPGMVALKLPPNAPPLAVDRSYHWYFKLYCGDSASATANFVEGWITRIPLESDLATRLKQGKNPAYKVYSNNLIWFDALDSLAQLRLNKDNPQLVREWNELLNAEGVNLGNLTQKPLMGAIDTSQDN